MATCHKCGAPNANYRRTTYTGYSTGSWLGKNSYGSSSRRYYGVRSVCEDCANSIDRWRRIKLIFWIAVIGLAIFYFSSSSKAGKSSQRSQSYHYSGQTARITATKGLNLRDQPGSAGAVLLTVPYNETVGIIDKSGHTETISGRTENWYKVDYKGAIGWLWGGYLKMQ